MAASPQMNGQSRRTRHSPWAIAATVTMATSMDMLDGSIVIIALPTIAGALSVTEEQSTWILTAYLISAAIILPMSGWLAIRFGRKRYYMSSVAFFTVSSLLCGLAPDLRSLIFFRVLQGVGAGGLGPSEQSILADTFVNRTALAFAIYGMVIVLAPTLGPTVGGYITDHFGWRWIFFINIPIGIASLFLSNRMLSDPEYLKKATAAKTPIDYIGLGLLAIGLGSLQVVLDRGQLLDWFESLFIVGLTSIAVIALFTVVAWEWFQQSPIIDLRLFRYRNFLIAFILMGFLAAILYGTLLMVPEFLQMMLGFSAQQAGATLWPIIFAVMPMLLLVAWLLNEVDARVVIVIGFPLTSLAIFHIAHNLSLSISSFDATMFVVYLASALTLLFVPLTTVSYTDVPQHHNNTVSSLLNFSRNIGGSFGISLVTTQLARREQYHQNILTALITPNNRQLHSFIGAYNTALTSAGASSSEALQLGAGTLYHTVVNQALTLSYIDVFWTMAVVTLCATSLVFFMKPHRLAASFAELSGPHPEQVRSSRP